MEEKIFMKKLILLFISSVLLQGLYATSSYGMSIFEAAKEGDNARMQELIAAHEDVNQKDNDGKTPLHWAASYREHQAVVQTLIAAGANVNKQDYEGRTPLHFAAYFAHQKVVPTLIKAHAYVNKKDIWGRTPLDSAWHPEVAKIIRDRISADEIFTALQALVPRLGANSPMRDLSQWIFRDHIFELLKKAERYRTQS